MGQIISLQDGWYNYELPKMPTREEDILGYKLKKKDQVWSIPPGPRTQQELRRVSESEKIEFIQLERERWKNGVWIFINGEATYITGMHYDHLVNMTFEFGKARYFDEQRKDFYMRDLVRKDKNSYGVVWFKPRRYGMTAEELTNSIYVSMEDFNRKVGLMSNEGKKAVETLMRPIIDAVAARPPYMRPTFYSPSGRKPRKALEYTDGSFDEDEDSDVMQEAACLGGNIMFYNTTTAAMDGKKEHYIVMDEVWKWITSSPKETLNINKKCVEDFGISGKISMLSTMGDSDDYAKSIKDGIQIGDESNPTVRDGNGRTTSGLYRYFVSSIHSKVLPAEFTNKYGKVDEGRALEFIYNDRAKLDPKTKDYTFEVRRMPIDYAEAIASADGSAIFPNQRLNKRRENLAKLPIGQKPYVRGFLDEDVEGNVSFRPDGRGVWKIAIMPYKDEERGINRENCYIKLGRKYMPPRNQEFCFGYDPVRYADKKAGSKGVSDAVILIAQRFDYFSSGIKRLPRYAAIYKERPQDPHEPTFELFKACKFFGMSGMHERQVEHVEEDFRDDFKASDMLMDSEKDGKKGIWTDSNRKVVKNGTDMIQSSMKVTKIIDISTGREVEYDPIDDIPFEEICLDRVDFDPMKTTESDVTMADIMLQNGMKQMKYTNATEQKKEANVVRKTIFPTRRTAV
jgi:hypothetical protein